MDETQYARQRRLWREGRETAQAIYGEWRHPDNIEWAAARRDKWRFDEAADLRRRVAILEAALNRQHVADEPEQTAGEPNESERPVERRSVPISITWRKSRHG